MNITTIRQKTSMMSYGQYTGEATYDAAIISTPPGAEIFIDNIYTGAKTSTIIKNLAITTHNMKLTLPGYEDYTLNIGGIDLVPGSVEIITPLMTPLYPPTGTGNINVTSNPTGAFFSLEGVQIPGLSGEIYTPITATNVPVGIYRYFAMMPITTPNLFAMGTFDILPGRTTDLHIPMVPISSTTGAAWIESIPYSADIYIDGTYLGAKTAFMADSPVGYHTYELRMAGYQTKTGSFVTTSGGDITSPGVLTIISENLQPIPGTTEAGFGTAGMVIVAGLAIGAIYIMMKKPKV